MKSLIGLLVLVFSASGLLAQPLTYYNGIDGLSGTALHDALHARIKNHTQYDYTTAKQILKQADEDPANPANLILIYTGWSIPKANFATYVDSVDYWNREHVWAKSHGDFGTDPGAGTDCHHLKPVDVTVNEQRSYKDFDNGGTAVFDAGLATGCKTDADSWEPRDQDKGDIARMILYMDVRYDGGVNSFGDVEPQLEVVDQVDTYPYPRHGKLSTLLQWNLQDPPDAFERRRNDVVANWQNNRNPFIDYPELAEYIWSGQVPGPVTINPVSMNPSQPLSADAVQVLATVNTSNGSISTVTLTWGTSWANLSNTLTAGVSGSVYSFSIPAQPAQTQVCFRIQATGTAGSKYFVGSYRVANDPFTGTLTPIYTIQGQAAATPLANQIVSTSGIVTGKFGSNFFMQDGTGPWSGLYVYNSGYFPNIGDSIILTGTAAEYYTMTELKTVTYFNTISSNNPTPVPQVLSTGDVDQEQWEAVLVRVEQAECVRDTLYGMWFVNDGSGDCIIHNSAVYAHDYTFGSVYNITGPLNFDFNQFKIELRSADDVEMAEDLVAPTLNTVTAASATIVNVVFSEDLETASAQNMANYQISGGVNITNAMLHSLQKSKVILTVNNMTGGTYTLNVSNVRDLVGNTILPASLDFSYIVGFGEPELKSFRIAPNPASRMIGLSGYATGSRQSLEIKDLAGKVVLERPVSENGTVDISSIQPGVYFLHLSGYKPEKLIIAR